MTTLARKKYKNLCVGKEGQRRPSIGPQCPRGLFAIRDKKDRDNVTRRLAEEHDMRRIEQMEMQQRLDNNERAGKTDIQDIYG